MKIASRYARQFSRQSFASLRPQLQVKQMLDGRANARKKGEIYA